MHNPMLRLRCWLLVAAAVVTQAAGAQSQDAAAVAKFEAMVAACRDRLAMPKVQVLQMANSQQWAKFVRWAIGDVTYDIRRTQSLVSPLTGHIAYSLRGAGDSADSEAAAAALVVTQEGPRPSLRRIELNFAFQGGEWVATEGRQVMEIPPNSRPMSMPYSKNDYRKPRSDGALCLGELPT